MAISYSKCHTIFYPGQYLQHFHHPPLPVHLVHLLCYLLLNILAQTFLWCCVNYMVIMWQSLIQSTILFLFQHRDLCVLSKSILTGSLWTLSIHPDCSNFSISHDWFIYCTDVQSYNQFTNIVLVLFYISSHTTARFHWYQ